jgi:hypothetical protein
MTAPEWLPVTGKWRVLGSTMGRTVGWGLGWKLGSRLGSRHRRRNGRAGDHTEPSTSTAHHPPLAIAEVVDQVISQGVARVASFVAGGQRRR